MFGIFKSKPMTYKNVPAATFKELMDTKKNTVVIDVRSEDEAREGKIVGAKVINLMSPTFQSSLNKLPKDATLLMYCRSGNRSASACRMAADLGFTDVYNLQGGVMEWNYGLKK